MKYKPPKRNKVEMAIQLAVRVYAGLTDKLGKPLVLHAMAVLSRLEDASEDTQIVACLHDGFEDGTLDTSEVEFLFGIQILWALQAITHKEGESDEDYWARCRKNDIARTVKVADIGHNTSPARMARLDEETRTRLTAKYEQAMKWMLYQENGSDTKDN